MAAGDIKHTLEHASAIELADGSFARLVSIEGGALDETNDAGNVEVSAGHSTITAIIPQGGEASNEIDLEGYSLVGFLMPSAWTTANLTIQGTATSGSGYTPVYDSGGTIVTISAAASRLIVPTAAHAAALAPLRYIRLFATATQAIARTITLIVKG
jgi:hypothetical protein